MKTERKSIAGVPHKRVPCSECGGLIWVHVSIRQGLAVCTDCESKPRGSLHLVGREERLVLSDVLYDGENCGGS